MSQNFNNKFLFNEKHTFLDFNSGLEIIKLSNFKINNLSEQVITYKGLYFPVKYYIHYGNLLDYYIGGYLQLKKIYPDLKIIFFKSDIDKQTSLNPRNELVVLDFVNYFNAEVIDIDSNSYYFENILLTDAESPIIPRELFKDFSTTPEEHDPITIQWRINSTKEILLEFNKYKSSKKNSKNMYISRSFINNHYIKRNDDWASYRVHDNNYDIFLDNLFKNNNYSIIEFFDKGFFDQIKIASEANIYIAIDGGSLINAMWCNEKTKIIQINLNKKYKDYNYYWSTILNSVNVKIDKVIDVTDLNFENAKEKIIQELSNYF